LVVSCPTNFNDGIRLYVLEFPMRWHDRASKDTDLSNTSVIAILDDDALSLRATARFVSSLGYSALAFGSAEEFLSSGRLDDTACVISDVQMPRMSGLELQRNLLARGFRLPIIFVTAFPSAKAREAALAMGALGFLDKPFDENHLIALLGQALPLVKTGEP
jgi:FixJ family two-component response regulator